jgi:hypothetical protein
MQSAPLSYDLAAAERMRCLSGFRSLENGRRGKVWKIHRRIERFPITDSFGSAVINLATRIVLEIVDEEAVTKCEGGILSIVRRIIRCSLLALIDT